MRLARAHAPVRRAMAALASRLIASRAWERLGFARLRDYAVERLGCSARSIHDLAHVHGALTELPGVDAAFLRGEIPWTKARLLARVATAADEAAWLDRARQMRAAALSHEIRKVDVGAIERSGLGPDDDDDEETRYENVQIRCTPQVQAKWHRTRQLAWRVVGHPVQPWECAELVAAEVLSALPMDGGADDRPAVQGPQDAAGGDSVPDASVRPGAVLPHGENGHESRDGIGVACGTGAVGSESAIGAPARAAGESDARPACASGDHDRHGLGPRNTTGVAGVDGAAGLAVVGALVEHLERAGPFQLDRRLRRAIRLEQRLDAEIGARLFLVAHQHLHLAFGYANFEDYVREGLGMAPRKMRALLRLERACRISPELGNAYRQGRLSWVQAHAVLPVLLIHHGRPHSDGWIGWAIQVSVRRLREDVEQALRLHETAPEAFAATAGLPVAARDSAAQGDAVAAARDRSRDRQIGAQPTGSAETTDLFVHAPREIAGLFRAVLCTVRRSMEQQTGRMPTEGQAFDAMLEHAADVWIPPGSRVRAARRVFARDGWRCTAPGCSSFRNLRDHHIGRGAGRLPHSM